MGYLYKLRLLSENAMDSDSIRYTDAINEVSITGIFHKIFGKTSKTKTIDDLEEKEATIVTANFKKAYDGWYPTITVRITSRTPKEFCDSLATLIYSKYHKVPNFMIFTAAEFNKEYNLTKNPKCDDNGSTKDLYFVAIDPSVIPNNKVAEFKYDLSARYFTDIVDNAVRIEMYSHKGYKPKPYIDMDNIAAAQKYLDSQ